MFTFFIILVAWFQHVSGQKNENSDFLFIIMALGLDMIVVIMVLGSF